MAYTPDLLEIHEEVLDNLGLGASQELAEGYQLRSFKRSVRLALLELNNRGSFAGNEDSQVVALSSGDSPITLPPDTFDVMDGFRRLSNGDPNNQIDYAMARRSRASYDRIPNKLLPGPPNTFYVERISSGVNVYFWPVPDGTGPYSFAYNRLRMSADATSYTATPDVTPRFLPCLISLITYRMAIKKPELRDDAASYLQDYERQFQLALSADSERADLRVYPTSVMDR